MATSITCTVNCSHRIAATLYSRHIVCFNYVVVNILCKADKHIILIIVSIITLIRVVTALIPIFWDISPCGLVFFFFFVVVVVVDGTAVQRSTSPP